VPPDDRQVRFRLGQILVGRSIHIARTERPVDAYLGMSRSDEIAQAAFDRVAIRSRFALCAWRTRTVVVRTLPRVV